MKRGFSFIVALMDKGLAWFQFVFEELALLGISLWALGEAWRAGERKTV